MKNLIGKEFKHLLYKDELNDPFLLTKHCEIFKYSDDILGVYCWSTKYFSQVNKSIPISNDHLTSDKLYYFNTKVENLKLIIELGAQSRRVFRKGTWLKDKERRLGHKIYPYNPILKGENEQAN